MDRKVASSNTRRVVVFLTLCGVMLLGLRLCYSSFLRSQPLELSGCTTIEVEFAPSALEYFAPRQIVRDMLSPGEKDYLKSIETFTISDVNQIKTFAQDLALGVRKSRARGKPSNSPFVNVTCYRNQKHLTSLEVYGRTVVTEHNGIFEYPVGLPNLETIEPPETRRFKLRHDCARNMARFYKTAPFNYRKVNSYPEPARWCDAFVQYWRNLYKIRGGTRTLYHDELWISETLVCPGQYEQIASDSNSPRNVDLLSLECHYAMNPDCKPDSPGDMVLLFETKAGWNQHGGPELFTFDNHEPKGGCVLLNDGTVKFIRTQEELQQLRWK